MILSKIIKANTVTEIRGIVYYNNFLRRKRNKTTILNWIIDKNDKYWYNWSKRLHWNAPD